MDKFLKKFYFLIITLFIGSNFLYAQQKIDFRYSIDYSFFNNKKQENDTLTVNVDNKGVYFHTEYQGLTKELSQSIFKSQEVDIENTKGDIILDAHTRSVIINSELKNNILFIKASLDNFFPKQSDDLPISEVNFQKDSIININNKEYPVYKLIFNEDEENEMFMIIDESNPIDNSKLFQLFFSFSQEVKINPTFKSPKGLILGLKSKGNFMFKATSIKKINQSINITRPIQK